MKKYCLLSLFVLGIVIAFAQTTMSPEKFNLQLKKAKQPQLVDVRTSKEFAGDRLNQAIHLDWNDADRFRKGIAKLNKKEPIYVYCLSGGRSAKAAKTLHDEGFTVYELNGGLLNWKSENLPLVKPDTKLEGLSKKQFLNLLQQDDQILVDFFAPWCEPCRKMEPTLKKIASDYNGKVKLLKIDVDQNPQLAKELGIQSIPLLHVYKNGKQTWKHNGIADETTIKKQLN